MGGCCFTPKKTQLLWWYWLLLLSVVGIPMFLAAIYIKKRSQRGEPARKYALRASCIFWSGVVLSCILAMTLVFSAANGVFPNFQRHWGLVKLFAAFVFCMIITTAAAKAVEKRKGGVRRVGILLLYVFLWVCVVVGPRLLSPWSAALYFSILMLPVTMMQFAACMLPAHYWNRFIVSPSSRSARAFLLTLFVGTFLFWLVLQCGDIVHTHFYQALRGERLTKATFVQDMSDALR